MRPRIGIACSTMDAVDGRGVRRMHVPAPYVARVVEAGGLPLLFPVVDPAFVDDYLGLVDGLLLIGGDDVDPAAYGATPHPDLGPVDVERDRFEIALTRAAAARDVPTLGVCRGLQVMNVALGGTLLQHLPAEVPDVLVHGGRYDVCHDLAVVPGSRLARVLGVARTEVNSHHHQAVAMAAPSLVVTGTSSDGVVEAAEDASRRLFLGVQWHPERMEGADSTRRLFATLVEEAARAAATRSPETAGRPAR
ncbi:MAG: gamma-glutamyl-gamma-aminobutyrate hydrolase family protein [Planctomycetota bacterium]